MHAAIVAIAVDVDAVLPAMASCAALVSGMSPAAQVRTRTLGQIGPGIADLHVEDGPRLRLVGNQSRGFQLIVEAAIREKPAALVEGVRLARLADSSHRQYPRELLVGVDTEVERSDRPCPPHRVPAC